MITEIHSMHYDGYYLLIYITLLFLFIAKPEVYNHVRKDGLIIVEKFSLQHSYRLFGSYSMLLNYVVDASSCIVRVLGCVNLMWL